MTPQLRDLRDDLGAKVILPEQVTRIVSLVPSLTEAVEATMPGAIIAATDWCTHPAGLDVARIRGTKNPDVAAIIAMQPDLVIANEEENKPEHIGELRDAGVSVWVTEIRNVDQAIESMTRLFAALGHPSVPWLEQARANWANPEPVFDYPVTALIPIWRKPWMFVGSDTYAGELLGRLGIFNALGLHPERYPKLELNQVPDVELVVLPDEPYEFTLDDGPEYFAAHAALISGRLLTWYGPAMVDAPAELAWAIRSAMTQ
jgi:ABC-type Fe3+-hydroxamate transport system substrate-binding protein